MKKDSIISKGNEVIVPGSGETSEDIARASVVHNSGIILGGDLNIITVSKKINPIFLSTVISYGKQHRNLSKLAQGKSIVHIHNSDLAKMNFIYPSLDEQNIIIKTFQKIDRIIDLKQDQLALYEKLKKGLLQKLFPSDGESTPVVRFADFDGNWEQQKLDNYIIQYSKITVKNNQYPVFTSSRKGLFFQKDYYSGHQIASADNTGYNIVPRGYFTYRHMSDDLIFKFNINNLADFGIVSTLYPVFRTNEYLNSKYLQYQLNEGNEFKRFAILQKQGGSRTYMYLSKLKNLLLTMPKIEEQVRIASFLTLLDDNIYAQQQCIKQASLLKRYCLQKLFI